MKFGISSLQNVGERRSDLVKISSDTGLYLNAQMNY